MQHIIFLRLVLLVNLSHSSSYCSLANGANFAPKLGLFVGCFHHSLSNIAQQHMQHAAAQLKTHLRAAVLAPPSPALPTTAAVAVAGSSSAASSSASSRRQKNRRVDEAMQSASDLGGNPGLTAAVMEAAAAGAAERGADDNGDESERESEGTEGSAVGPFASSGGIWSSAADVVSEGALIFNRRAKCRAVFATPATLGSSGSSGSGGYHPVQSSSVLKQGGVVDYAVRILGKVNQTVVTIDVLDSPLLHFGPPIITVAVLIFVFFYLHTTT